MTTAVSHNNSDTSRQADVDPSILPDTKRRDMLSILKWCIEQAEIKVGSSACIMRQVALGPEVQRMLLETLEGVAMFTGPDLLEGLLVQLECSHPGVTAMEL